jgi:hypothetical protein
MDKDRQIEEMARDMCGFSDCLICSECSDDCQYYLFANRLYKKGYRKQSEGEWEKADEFTEQYGYLYKCSVCGVLCWHGNYCPNCGAKMTKGDAD